MKFSKLISHALPVFLFAILAAGSGSKQDINCGGNNEQYSVRCDEVVAPPPPPYISAKTRAKAQRGLFDAQNGKIEKGLYWAEQAKKINLDARRDHPDFYEENQETMDNDLDYIEDSISQIKDLERESAEKKRLEAEENDSLDEANQELDSLNFGNNNENKFDDIKDPNEYIFQSPQTPSTPSMPETFSYPDTYDYGSEG